MNDIRVFCSTDTARALHSVLSFERTFNLSSLYLTLMVFKHRKIVRKSTEKPPVFVGSTLLHGDGKYATYLNFSIVNGALNGTEVSASEFRLTDNVVVGADDENAMVSAAKTAFSQLEHLFCMVHVKDNVLQHLTAIEVATGLQEKLFRGCLVALALHSRQMRPTETTELQN